MIVSALSTIMAIPIVCLFCLLANLLFSLSSICILVAVGRHPKLFLMPHRLQVTLQRIQNSKNRFAFVARLTATRKVLWLFSRVLLLLSLPVLCD